ncbi:MAG: 30S ribosomal protein S6 [Candidatus Buchananbacteria bacterium]|nr:30S ribosomal protein S6 [Candidatus Buchananbacteria bacterium]
MSEEQKNNIKEEDTTEKNEETKKDQQQPIPAQPTEDENEEQEEKIEHYELLYIVPISYSVDELKPITEKIIKLIKDYNGEITKEEDLGKLKLAYPIKQQSHGYYQLVEFKLPTNVLKSLNESLRLINEVLRFLIVKKKIKTEKELIKEKALQDKLAKKKEEAIEKIKAAKEEPKEKTQEKDGQDKVSLEDLDKKLDELLDTDDIV